MYKIVKKITMNKNENVVTYNNKDEKSKLQSGIK